jgi:transcriptional regulator with XRE-family HTH domain
VPGTDNPLVQQRRLLSELRRAREDSDLTQRDVADALEWSVSKLIRIENGTVGIGITDLKALLQHYDITDKQRVENFVEMARASKKAAWWNQYKDYGPQHFPTFLGLEASAIRLRVFQSVVVHGLLQIPEYSLPMVRSGAPDEETVTRGLEIRRKRQAVLEPDGPEMFFILDESVLHRVIGDEQTLRRQLERLKELAELPHLSIQIMPFKAGIHPGMKTSFEIFELSDDLDDYALLLEQPYKDTLIPNSSEETREYVNYFFQLEKIALPASETPRVIDERLKQMGS